MLKILGLFLFLTISLIAKAEPREVFISLDSKLYQTLLAKEIQVKEMNRFSGDVSLIKIPMKDLELVSSIAHDEFHRCGGFVFEENPTLASLLLQSRSSYSNQFSLKLNDRSTVIPGFIKEVNQANVRSTIEELSNFQNRYYRSSHGVSSQEWILETWKKLAKGHTNIKVAKFNHSRFNQPSVILTIEGTDLKDEIVVLGGHGDSIEGWSSNPSMKAPGADDNASGIATLTEIIRVLLAKGHKPRRTIQFISYAAEEVGLRGSQEIASKYSREGKNIKGVVQFDMTNFNSSQYDIVFIKDHTSASMTDYLVSLLKKYMPEIKYGYDRCGYACSDHASWDRYDFPVAFPFESTFAGHNRKIHTTEDTLLVSGDHAEHASKFARLGVAFAVEASQ